jgi:site-specific recombinase XerD
MHALYTFPKKQLMKNEVLCVEKMNEEEFRKYLKRRGKKQGVVDRNVRILKVFISYLLEKREKDLDGVTTDDIDAFVMEIESGKQSAKGYLYVLMNYFHFLGNKDLLNHTVILGTKELKKREEFSQLRNF